MVEDRAAARQGHGLWPVSQALRGPRRGRPAGALPSPCAVGVAAGVAPVRTAPTASTRLEDAGVCGGSDPATLWCLVARGLGQAGQQTPAVGADGRVVR